jgi:hypothetical protein
MQILPINMMIDDNNIVDSNVDKKNPLNKLKTLLV